MAPGNALGLLPQLVVAANMTRLSLSLAGGSFLLVGLISLISIPVLRQASITQCEKRVDGSHLIGFISLITSSQSHVTLAQAGETSIQSECCDWLLHLGVPGGHSYATYALTA